jgi:hypothetical protein
MPDPRASDPTARPRDAAHDASFFSAPLDLAELERLRAAVEARLALRGPEPDAVTALALEEFVEGATVPPYALAVAGLGTLGGPLFDVRHGRRLARLAKRLANLVSAPFARPQRYFNAAVRAAIASRAAVLEHLTRDVARTADALARCDERLAALERQMIAGSRRA